VSQLPVSGRGLLSRTYRSCEEAWPADTCMRNPPLGMAHGQPGLSGQPALRSGSALAGRLMADQQLRIERYMQAVFVVAAAALFVRVVFHTSTAAPAIFERDATHRARPGGAARSCVTTPLEGPDVEADSVGECRHAQRASRHPISFTTASHSSVAQPLSGLPAPQTYMPGSTAWLPERAAMEPTEARLQPAHACLRERATAPSRAGISREGKLQLLAFCAVEATVGLFWPSMMQMRSQHLPEESRSTILNFSRIPLNLFVCAVLCNARAPALPAHPAGQLCACEGRRRLQPTLRGGRPALTAPAQLPPCGPPGNDAQAAAPLCVSWRRSSALCDGRT